MGQRLGGSHQPLHDVQGLDQPLVEERRMADRFAAVAGLNREAARAGLLVQPERRVPPRAGEDRRRQQGEPALRSKDPKQKIVHKVCNYIFCLNLSELNGGWMSSHIATYQLFFQHSTYIFREQ